MFRGAIFQYPLVLTALLVSSFLSLIMFGASAVGGASQRIRRAQEVLGRFRTGRRVIMLCAFHLYVIASIILFSLSVPHRGSGILAPFIIGFVAGQIAILFVIAFAFSRLFRRAGALPSAGNVFARRDYLYGLIPLAVFAITFILSFFTRSSL